MMKPVNAPGLGFFSATYGTVLTLLPSTFRSEYESDVRTLFREMYVDAYGRAGLRGALSFSLLAIRRVLMGAFVERRSDGASEDSAAANIGGSSKPPRKRGPVERTTDRLRAAWRSIRRNPGFSATAILLMGLGIGATATIFSVVDGVLLRALPYPESERIAYLENGSHSPTYLKDIQSEVGSFSDVVGGWNRALDLIGDGPPVRVPTGWVTEGFLEFFGVTQPLLGRLFTPEDHVGPQFVAILSHQFWVERWGADPDVIGRTMTLDGNTVEVVGVLERGFQPPEAMMGSEVDLWTPFDLDDPEYQHRGFSILSVAGRLAPDVTLEMADIEMAEFVGRLAQAMPTDYTNRDGDPYLTPPISLHEATVAGMGSTLYMLFGAVALLLVIACVNVANLMLARGSERVRETALRGALGADRRALIVELLLESSLLSVFGGVVGVAVSFLGLSAFKSLSPGGIPRLDAVGLDWRVLLFALGCALLTGLIFGVIPSLQASSTAPGRAMRGSDSQATLSRGAGRFQSGLVVGELALSLILLVGAGLLFHSFVNIMRVDPGFDTERLVSVQLRLTAGYDPAAQLQFERRLTESLESIPGVTRVGAGYGIPFQFTGNSRCCWSRTIPSPDDPEQAHRALLQPVTEGYFDALDATLAYGREFEPGDEDLIPVPAVLSSFAAETFFGDSNPVGELLSIGDEPTEQIVVVGVLSPLRHWGLQQNPDLEVYLPYRRFSGDLGMLGVVARTAGDPARMVSDIRSAIWDLDPNLPIDRVEPMTARVDASVARERFLLTLLSSFSLIALVLATAGVYGTFTYLVRRRNREMGIRRAVGASGPDVVRLIVRRGVGLVALGLLTGGLGALWLVRFLEGMVFGISTTDPGAILSGGAILAGVAILACLLPAIRASKVDPLKALRVE